MTERIWLTLFALVAVVTLLGSFFSNADADVVREGEGVDHDAAC